MNLTIRPWTYRDLDALTRLWQGRRDEPRPLLPDTIQDWLLNRVAGNTFFDREGLLLAFDTDPARDPKLVGMIHAGFPPTQDYLNPIAAPADSGRMVTRREGIILMAIVDESLEAESQREVMRAMLRAIETYLEGRYVQIIYSGAMRPVNNPPFWNGFCGAGDAWGVPDSDLMAHEVFSEAGYREVRRTAVWRLNLSTPQRVRTEVLRAQRSFNAISRDWKPETTWEMVTAAHGTAMEFAVLHLDGRTLGRLVMRKIAEVRGGVLNDLFVTHWMECRSLPGSPPSARQEMVLVLWDTALTELRRISPNGEVEWIMCNDPTFASRIAAARLFGFEIIKEGTVRRRELR